MNHIKNLAKVLYPSKVSIYSSVVVYDEETESFQSVDPYEVSANLARNYQFDRDYLLAILLQVPITIIGWSRCNTSLIQKPKINCRIIRVSSESVLYSDCKLKLPRYYSWMNSFYGSVKIIQLDVWKNVRRIKRSFTFYCHISRVKVNGCTLVVDGVEFSYTGYHGNESVKVFNSRGMKGNPIKLDFFSGGLITVL